MQVWHAQMDASDKMQGTPNFFIHSGLNSCKMYIKKKPLKLLIPSCFSHTKPVVQNKWQLLPCHTMQPMGKKYCKEHNNRWVCYYKCSLIVCTGKWLCVQAKSSIYHLAMQKKTHLFDENPPSDMPMSDVADHCCNFINISNDDVGMQTHHT